jgi:hypothetical protein
MCANLPIGLYRCVQTPKSQNLSSTLPQSPNQSNACARSFPNAHGAPEHGRSDRRRRHHRPASSSLGRARDCTRTGSKGLSSSSARCACARASPGSRARARARASASAEEAEARGSGFPHLRILQDPCRRCRPACPLLPGLHSTSFFFVEKSPLIFTRASCALLWRRQSWSL